MPDGFFDASGLMDAAGTIANSARRNDGTIRKLWVPNTVKRIDTRAFAGCVNLEEVLFEDGTDSLCLGLMAFEGCKDLRSVSLPARVSSVGAACFRGCESLNEFSMAAGVLPLRFEWHVFDDCPDATVKNEILKAECTRRSQLSVGDVNKKDKNPGKKKDAPAQLTPDTVGQYVLYPAVKGDVQQSLPNGIPNGTLFVCVDKTWGDEKKDDITHQRISIVDCARGYWWSRPMDKARSNACHWLMAISHKSIAGVWKIDLDTGWRSPEEISKPSWPSDRGPWKVTRIGCQFLPDDEETLAVRQACEGKQVNMNFTQFQVVRGVFLKGVV